MLIATVAAWRGVVGREEMKGIRTNLSLELLLGRGGGWMRTGPKERRRSLSVHIRNDAGGGGGGGCAVVTGNRNCGWIVEVIQLNVTKAIKYQS